MPIVEEVFKRLEKMMNEHAEAHEYFQEGEVAWRLDITRNPYAAKSYQNQQWQRGWNSNELEETLPRTAEEERAEEFADEGERERGDDDGMEYADPSDEIKDRLDY